MKNRWAVFLFAFVISIQCYQVSSASVIKQTGFRQFSTEQGLSQNTIRHFFQDEEGYMWVATDAGLNRLDGNQIETLKNAPEILSSDAIVRIRQDLSKQFWVATFKSLIRLSEDLSQAETFYLPTRSKNPEGDNFAIDIFEEENGSFWLISWEAIYRLEAQGKNILEIPSMRLLTDQNIRIHTALDTQSKIWLGTSSGLFAFDKSSRSLVAIPLSSLDGNSRINQIIALNNSRLLIASNEGLIDFKHHKNSTENQRLITHDRVSSMAQIGQTVYFSVEDQVHALNISDNLQQHYFSLSEILPNYTSYTITKLFVDKNMKLWIGTDSQGAYLWNPESLKFKTISNITATPSLKLNDNTVWNFLEDRKGNFWIATENGLNYLDLTKGTIESHLSRDISGNTEAEARLFSIVGNQETLWIGSADGLIKYNPQTRARKVYRPELLGKTTKPGSRKSFFIYSITQTPDGNIWAATEYGALRFNPETSSFSYDNQLMSRDKFEISTFVRFQQGKLWFGFKDKLISYDYLKKQKEEIFQVSHSNRSAEIYLTDFHLDKNRIWASFSGAGIYVIDVKKGSREIVKHFIRKNGFVDNVVYSLVLNGQDLWATTHSGLVKINKKNFQSLVYDFYDGLPSNEFNEGANYKTAGGKLVFGGTSGFIQIDPEKLPAPDEHSTPSITKVQLANREIITTGDHWINNEITLKPSENQLTINVSMLDYLTPHKWQYLYWLTGQQTTKPELTASNTITFSNLTKGSYQLHIKAVLPNFKTFDQETTLNFSVQQPSTVTLEINPLFYATLIILILVIIYRKKINLQRLSSYKEQMNQSKQQLKLALMDEESGIWHLQLDNHNIDNSLLTITITDKNIVDLHLSKYISYIHPRDLEQSKRKWKEFLSSSKNGFAQVYRVYFYQSWLWVNVSGLAHRDNETNKILSISGNWKNISIDRRNQNHLSLFKRAILHTQNIVITANSKAIIQSINNPFQQKISEEFNQLKNKNLFSTVANWLDDESKNTLSTKVDTDLFWQGTGSFLLDDNKTDLIIKIEAVTEKSKLIGYVLVITNKLEQNTINLLASDEAEEKK